MSSKLVLGLLAASSTVFALVLVGACSSSSSSSPAAFDAGIDAAVEAGATDFPTLTDAACNSLPTLGGEVPVEVADGAVTPSGSGGSIVNGTYQLTAFTQYGGAAPVTNDDSGAGNVAFKVSIALSIAGGTWQVAGTDPSTGSYTTTYAATVSDAGTPSVELDETCPDDEDSETITYSATPTSITWYRQTADGLTTESVFTKE